MTKIIIVLKELKVDMKKFFTTWSLLNSISNCNDS